MPPLRGCSSGSSASGLATLLSRSVGAAAVAIAFLAVVAFLVLGYARDLRSAAERGITSEVAFGVTLVAGSAGTIPLWRG